LPAALTNDGATITYTSGESGASSVCRGIKITLPSPRSSTTRNHPPLPPCAASGRTTMKPASDPASEPANDSPL